MMRHAPVQHHPITPCLLPISIDLGQCIERRATSVSGRGSGHFSTCTPPSGTLRSPPSCRPNVKKLAGGIDLGYTVVVEVTVRIELFKNRLSGGNHWGRDCPVAEMSYTRDQCARAAVHWSLAAAVNTQLYGVYDGR